MKRRSVLALLGGALAAAGTTATGKLGLAGLALQCADDVVIPTVTGEAVDRILLYRVLLDGQAESIAIVDVVLREPPPPNGWTIQWDVGGNRTWTL